MRYICASIVATLVLAGTSFAATINVPGDQPTIAAAISASVNGDVINIAAGTYNEHSLNPNNKAITIGSASGNLDVTIDANGGGSVFVIDSGEGANTVIRDLVITGGLASGLWPSNSGGGICCYNSSSPTITNCTISENTGTGGGGILCYDNSTPTITDCTITGNTADASGGGIYCYNSNPTISDCTIEGNTAYRGGGIFCYGSSSTISDCTISGNTAYRGGGIFCDNSSATISGCTISDNTASGGGGIRSNSDPTISNSIICGNAPDQILGSYTASESCIEQSCVPLCYADSDADGIPDYLDQCPNDPDNDIDGDGVCGGEDAFPNDPNEWADSDGDGTGDNGDGCPNDPDNDIDGDGVCGDVDAFPNDPNEWADSDGDGLGDNEDGQPRGACCVVSGCVATNSSDCTGLGGNWLGEDASCDDCAPTCQGDANADGVVDIFDLLKVIDGWGTCP